MCKVGFYDGSEERFVVMDAVLTKRCRRGEERRLLTRNELDFAKKMLQPDEVLVDVSMGKESQDFIPFSQQGAHLLRVGAKGQVRPWDVVAQKKKGGKKL